MAISNELIADGSRDLYPAGVDGYRGGIRTRLSDGDDNSIPFPNKGVHYVYAKAGETIGAATSAQGTNNAAIRIYGLDGTTVVAQSKTDGKINNRTAELAGPSLNPSGNQYSPLTYTVTADGIYKVELDSPQKSTSNFDHVKANDSWTQRNTDRIMAWDVSVFSTNGTIIPGRVYLTSIDMYVTDDGAATGSNGAGFHGMFFVLTNDGEVYRVNNNGNNGITFSFFSSNTGIVDHLGNPIYSSIHFKSSASEGFPDWKTSAYNQTYNPHIPDPRLADADGQVTNKTFYTIPAADLPLTASGAVPGGTTWLSNESAEISNVSIQGYEGTEGQIAQNKGGYVMFNSNADGVYNVTINPKIAGDFAPIHLSGVAKKGLNKIAWNGKDGDGALISPGEQSAVVNVSIQAGEVHFIFTDVEYNRHGIIIERLDRDNFNRTNPRQSPNAGIGSDIVFWNDEPLNEGDGGIPPNPVKASHLDGYSNGQPSLTNGHKWDGRYGNNMAIDTWTFFDTDPESKDGKFIVNKADLEVNSLVMNPSGNLSVNQELTYTIKLRNNGETDAFGSAFHFVVPHGFEPLDVEFYTFDGKGCGAEEEDESLSFDTATNTFKSKLDLPANCEVVYEISVKVTENVQSGPDEVKAGVLRPADVYDPDGTNTSNPANPEGDLDGTIDMENYFYPPFDPFIEAANNGKNGVSNNVKVLPVNIIGISDLAIKKTADKDDAIVGDDVVFKLTVTNYGSHHAFGVIVTDNIPAGYSDVKEISDGGSYQEEEGIITWDLGTLEYEEVKILTFKASVNSVGPYLNISTVDGDVEDPDMSNNRSTYDPVKVNYWIGGTVGHLNEWGESNNWTAGRVPDEYEDIEFATEENNPTVADNPKSGPAKEDLHLDKDRIIGDLTNNSSKDLIITQGNQLIIDGVVIDENEDEGTIIVEAGVNQDDDHPEAISTGTLLFNNPNDNKNVQATVEFYNKAYECADCGFFRKSWQYFGIPVASAEFPYNDVTGDETINQWVESVNGNKWLPAPYTPDAKLMAFRGYEITNSINSKPTDVYKFTGTLNVGNAEVELTNSGSGVNYPGMNLIANSFTAAIPISDDAIQYNNWNKTVYLFNTGTRDQWRKLNGGSVIEGVNIQAGTYQSVPLNLAGQEGLPSQIPSMHTFMVNAPSSGTMTLAYDKLVKNELVDGMAWRSAQAEKREIPHIVLDVIGSNSADRVWLFEQAGTTRGFDAGWDGVKMPEKDIVQIYVAGETAGENYQVATVPQMVGTSFGLNPVKTIHELSLQIHIAVSADVEARGLYLRDMLTGRSYALKNGAEYQISASAASDNRFKVVDTMLDESKLGANPLIDIYVVDGQVVVANNSDEECTVTLFDAAGKLVAKKAASRNSTTYINNATRTAGGVYVVKVAGTQEVNEIKRVIVK